MSGMVRVPVKPNDTASYIEQATRELRDLAQRSEMPFLAYLIDMARLEAADVALRAPRGPVADDPTVVAGR